MAPRSGSDHFGAYSRGKDGRVGIDHHLVLDAVDADGSKSGRPRQATSTPDPLNFGGVLIMPRPGWGNGNRNLLGRPPRGPLYTVPDPHRYLHDIAYLHGSLQWQVDVIPSRLGI